MLRFRPLLLGTTVACVALTASAAELHVPSQYATIQSAVDHAQNDDVIVVAPGTYRESVSIAGRRLTIRSSAGAAATIFDGTTLDTSILSARGGRSSAPTVVQGFTFRNGRGTLPAACDLEGRKGGAIFAFNATVSIIDSVFEQNGARRTDGSETIASGGAIFGCESDLAIADSRFTANRAAFGGGIDFNSTVARQLQIERVTFTDHYAGFGGGISADFGSTSSVTVADATFDDNAGGHGGAIHLEGHDGATATIRRNTFRDNHVGGAGAAIHLLARATNVWSIEECTFDGHTATNGAGISANVRDAARVAFRNLSFRDGEASFGAGMQIVSSETAAVDLEHCEWLRHRAGFGAGLFAIAMDGARIHVDGSRFLDNVVYQEPATGVYQDSCFIDGRAGTGDGFYYGGGADVRTSGSAAVAITNSLFAGNDAIRGGGIHAGSCAGGTIDLVNNTVVDNGSNGVLLRFGKPIRPGVSGKGTMRVTNSIVRDNRGTAAIAVEQLDPQGVTTLTFNNIDGDAAPSFLDAAARDYRLAPGSIGIDAGDNAAVAATAASASDAAGAPRFRGTFVDLGAYEYQPPPSRRRAARK